MNKARLVASNAAGTAFLLLAVAQSQTVAFRAVQMPADNERVTGVYCASAKACVISTETFGGVGHVYASDGQKITGAVVTGDQKFAEKLGTLGELAFMGFTKVGDRLITNVMGAGAGFVSATGDITKPASWTSEKIGSLDGGGTFGLNQQMGIGTKDGRWVSFRFRTIAESTDAPGAGALWTDVWSPVSPSIPKDFDQLRRADAKLCDSDPGVSISPRLTQPAYVAPDLSIILYPNGAVNQRGSGNGGVCVSVDGGKRFRLVEFKGVNEGDGPVGVTCTSAAKCFAYGDQRGAPAPAYIWYTNDAQKGADAAWTAAKLPSLRDGSTFRHVFFTPDGKNGWAVGWSNGSSPLMLATADGGATWTDASSSVRAVASSAKLHAGFALDATHVWVGGEKGVLLTSGN